MATLEVEDEGAMLRTQIIEIALERIQDLIWINSVNHQILEATPNIASHLLCFGNVIMLTASNSASSVEVPTSCLWLINMHAEYTFNLLMIEVNCESLN